MPAYLPRSNDGSAGQVDETRRFALRRGQPCDGGRAHGIEYRESVIADVEAPEVGRVSDPIAGGMPHAYLHELEARAAPELLDRLAADEQAVPDLAVLGGGRIRCDPVFVGDKEVQGRSRRDALRDTNPMTGRRSQSPAITALVGAAAGLEVPCVFGPVEVREQIIRACADSVEPCDLVPSSVGTSMLRPRRRRWSNMWDWPSRCDRPSLWHCGTVAAVVAAPAALAAAPDGWASLDVVVCAATV